MVIKATSLKIMDEGGGIFRKKSPGSSDPFVTVEVGSKKVKTKVISKSLNPVWNESFVIRHSNPGSVLTVKVDDYDKLSGSDFIGQFKVPVGKLKGGEENREWRTLETLEGDVSDKLGRLLVAFRWCHNKDAKVGQQEGGGGEETGAGAEGSGVKGGGGDGEGKMRNTKQDRAGSGGGGRKSKRCELR